VERTVDLQHFAETRLAFAPRAVTFAAFRNGLALGHKPQAERLVVD